MNQVYGKNIIHMLNIILSVLSRIKGQIICIKYRSRPVNDMLKNILGYIHGKVRMLFTGIEICKNDIKCCIFVILCR
jgi:hypothetical protein